MGTKLSMAEKDMMAKILKQDLSAINAEVTKQFRELWERCRVDLEVELGITDKTREIEEMNRKVAELQVKIGELQQGIREYNDHPTVKDYQEAGLELPTNRNGYIYNHDRQYMGIPISTLMDILIVRKIKSMCDPDKPIALLNEIAESAYRALIMSGTFEEARKAYDSFYDLDFQRFGVKIPRRLGEIKKGDAKNLMTAQVVPALPAPEEPKKED